MYRVGIMEADGSGLDWVTHEDSSATLVQWMDGGTSVCVDMTPDKPVVKLAVYNLDGELQTEYRAHHLWANLTDADTQGRVLYTHMNEGTSDVSLQTNADDPIEPLFTTPLWERAAKFGPGPNQITVSSKTDLQEENSRLGIMDLTDGTFEYLPLEADHYYSFAWNTEGRYLAYSSGRAGSQDIWIWDRKSNNHVQITDSLHRESGPEWSPDSETMLFRRTEVTSDVFLKDYVADTERKLTDTGRDKAPEVSPDGEWVMFLRDPTAEERANGGSVELMVMPSDGGAAHAVGAKNIIVRQENSMSWSPDSKEITYTARTESGNVQVFRAPREGGDPIQVTVSPGYKVFPRWSPDGSMIAYTKLHQGGAVDVWAVPSVGGNPTQLSYFDSQQNVFAVWSPDGDRIAYTAIQNDGNMSVVIAPVDRPRETSILVSHDKPTFAICWTEGGDALLCWVNSEPAGLFAFYLDQREPVFVAKAPEEGPMILDFTPEGKKYGTSLNKTGRYAYAHGETISDLYRVAVSDRLAPALARGASQ